VKENQLLHKDGTIRKEIFPCLTEQCRRRRRGLPVTEKNTEVYVHGVERAYRGCGRLATHKERLDCYRGVRTEVKKDYRGPEVADALSKCDGLSFSRGACRTAVFRHEKKEIKNLPTPGLSKCAVYQRAYLRTYAQRRASLRACRGLQRRRFRKACKKQVKQHFANVSARLLCPKKCAVPKIKVSRKKRQAKLAAKCARLNKKASTTTALQTDAPQQAVDESSN